jgi:hypothetical protein
VLSCYKEILQAKMQAGTQTTLDLFFAKHSSVMEKSALQAGPSNFATNTQNVKLSHSTLLKVKILMLSLFM